MHICFLTNEYPKEGFPHGGVGSFVKTMAEALTQRGIQVSVVGLNYNLTNETEELNGVTIIRLKKSKIKRLAWYFNSKAISKAIYDLHNQRPLSIVEGAELSFAFLPKIKAIKYIIRLHGGHHFFAEAEKRGINWWKGFQEKRSFKKANHIIAVSKYVAETTRELLKLGNRPIEIIYNPVDIYKFYQSDHNKTQKATIFFAGSIVEKKGVRQLLQSLNYLVDEFPDVHLYIAGRDAKIPGTDIPYRPILEKEINEKINSHITFLGVVPNGEIAAYIERAEVCCYPSHMEAMPLAWLEVLAMGKAFIGGNTGPGPEAVIDNVTGLLADPYDPKDIADKISYIFNNPKKGIEMGKIARGKILKEFSVEKIVERNLEFYKKIIE